MILLVKYDDDGKVGPLKRDASREIEVVVE